MREPRWHRLAVRDLEKLHWRTAAKIDEAVQEFASTGVGVLRKIDVDGRATKTLVSRQVLASRSRLPGVVLQRPFAGPPSLVPARRVRDRPGPSRRDSTTPCRHSWILGGVVAGERIRCRVDVVYHSNQKPPADRAKLEGASPEKISRWVRFYIAKTVTVTVGQWQKNGYSKALPNALAEGSYPPVTGEIVETIEAIVLKALRAGLDKSTPRRTFGSGEYAATRYNTPSLAAAIDRTPSQTERALRRLSDGGEAKLTIGAAARIYVKE